MKFAREMKAKAIELGFQDVKIEHRGRSAHPVLIATIRGRPVRYFFAGTPSDGRARQNNLADLRRMAREADR
jgi:hypothetical protein